MSDVSLQPGEMCSLRGGITGIELTCEQGSLWITHEGDPEDHVLSQGQTLRVSSGGMILVSALGEASFSVRPLVERPAASHGVHFPFMGRGLKRAASGRRA